MILTDAHQFLIDLGYEYIYFSEAYEDDGDGENGPNAIYYPGYGEYRDSNSSLYVEANGSVEYVDVVDYEPANFYD